MTPDAGRDPALPDTAMHSGSDEGEPGERLPGPELSGADREVLAALTRRDTPTVTSVDDGPAAARAAEDDAALPSLPGAASGAAADDPLTPVFREPPA